MEGTEGKRKRERERTTFSLSLFLLLSLFFHYAYSCRSLCTRTVRSGVRRSAHRRILTDRDAENERGAREAKRKTLHAPFSLSFFHTMSPPIGGPSPLSLPPAVSLALTLYKGHRLPFPSFPLLPLSLSRSLSLDRSEERGGLKDRASPSRLHHHPSLLSTPSLSSLSPSTRHRCALDASLSFKHARRTAIANAAGVMNDEN